jgi:hypothetical protein
VVPRLGVDADDHAEGAEEHEQQRQRDDEDEGVLDGDAGDGREHGIAAAGAAPAPLAAVALAQPAQLEGGRAGGFPARIANRGVIERGHLFHTTHVRAGPLARVQGPLGGLTP